MARRPLSCSVSAELFWTMEESGICDAQKVVNVNVRDQVAWREGEKLCGWTRMPPTA